MISSSAVVVESFSKLRKDVTDGMWERNGYSVYTLHFIISPSQHACEWKKCVF